MKFRKRTQPMILAGATVLAAISTLPLARAELVYEEDLRAQPSQAAAPAQPQPSAQVEERAATMVSHILPTMERLFEQSGCPRP